MIETKRLLREAKRDIERAIVEISLKLEEQTGLVVSVKVETLDASTSDKSAKVYVAKLTFSI